MSIERAASLFQESHHSVVLTGAGISTPSGIPDFRSAGSGLWQKYNPMEVASLTTFRTRPEMFYEWFRPLSKLIVDAVPNPAHEALAKIEEGGYIQETITQNIDGLHQRAGSNIVHEVHGTLNTLTCGKCFTKYDSGEFVQSYIEEGCIPQCKACSNILKPDVVFFEEQLPVETWQAAEKAINECDLLLVAGSSLEVVPVAHLPYIAVNRRAKLIVVNNTPTYIDSRADVVFNQDVVDVIPEISNVLIQ